MPLAALALVPLVPLAVRLAAARAMPLVVAALAMPLVVSALAPPLVAATLLAPAVVLVALVALALLFFGQVRGHRIRQVDLVVVGGGVVCVSHVHIPSTIVSGGAQLNVCSSGSTRLPSASGTRSGL